MNLATHGIGQCRGIASSPDKKHEASLRRLQIVDVDIRGWGLIHLAVPHVADDSDHLRSIIKAALSNSDGFSDRILIWPKPARGGFVDEHDFRSSHTIGVRKQAAFDEGNAHGLEKLRRCPLHSDDRPRARRHRWTVAKFDESAIATAGQWIAVV